MSCRTTRLCRLQGTHAVRHPAVQHVGIALSPGNYVPLTLGCALRGPGDIIVYPQSPHCRQKYTILPPREIAADRNPRYAVHQPPSEGLWPSHACPTVRIASAAGHFAHDTELVDGPYLEYPSPSPAAALPSNPAGKGRKCPQIGNNRELRRGAAGQASGNPQSTRAPVSLPSARPSLDRGS